MKIKLVAHFRYNPNLSLVSGYEDALYFSADCTCPVGRAFTKLIMNRSITLDDFEQIKVLGLDIEIRCSDYLKLKDALEGKGIKHKFNSLVTVLD